MLERTIKIPVYTPPAQGSWVFAFLAWSFVIQSLNVLTADRYLPLHKQNSSNLNYLEKELSSIPNQLKICIKIQIMLKKYLCNRYRQPGLPFYRTKQTLLFNQLSYLVRHLGGQHKHLHPTHDDPRVLSCKRHHFTLLMRCAESSCSKKTWRQPKDTSRFSSSYFSFFPFAVSLNPVKSN